MHKEILIVARWPLGGIRTYMRYMFAHFPKEYRLTLLAASSHEDAALIDDAKGFGARLVLVRVTGTRNFSLEIFKELRRNKYDLILSQGFVSAVTAYFANFIYKIPHILTIHGIAEPQYLEGRLKILKRFVFGKILSGITVLYGVSNDILEHLYQEFPKLRYNGPQSLVIQNGIEPSDFDLQPISPLHLREQLGLTPSVFLFGFFGRFMPQKGFDLIIEAVDVIRKQLPDFDFAVVAVGSGDYIGAYKATIRQKELGAYFYFLPFQPIVHHLYPQVDAIVMPSRWEASALLAMEVLCVGTPLIASNCIGLRETITDTPAIVFSSENLQDLIETMTGCLQDNNKTVFQKFLSDARQRFDVAASAEKLVQAIEHMSDQK